MSYHNYNTFLVPLALLDQGISAYKTIDQYGILTSGLEWKRSSIWANQNPVISTSWTNKDFAGTTTWTNRDFVGTTVWTNKDL